MARRAREDPAGRAAVHSGRNRQGEGSLRAVRRHDCAPARADALMPDLSLVWPALIAGLLVTATHAPLGIQVLNRGIVFIDLAVAQIAGLGVIVADWMGFEPQGAAVQIAALAAALAGALLLNWTDKRWPEVQEAVIGVTFIVAANAAILLLASNP